MLTESLAHRLSKQSTKRLNRTRKVITSNSTNHITVDGHLCIDFSNNDYLGLKMHPRIIEALQKGASKYGVGSGASPLVSGYSKAHQEVEQVFAQWLNVDCTMLFSSGYTANTSIIRALSHRSDTIFSDKLCHASLLDGIQLSRAKHRRYHHNDLTHLKQLADQNKPNLMVTESVFSMDGDITPTAGLSSMAKRYGSGLIIDDAHGIGVLGKMGKGIIEHDALTQQGFSCLVAPLGKAFGVMGAIVAGRQEVIESMLQFAKSYTYSTALSPAICIAIKTALELIQDESWQREQLHSNIRFFIEYASHRGLDLIDKSATPIKPIMIGSCSKLMRLQNYLWSKGFYVAAIRPPTVPQNKARLRLSLNALHTQEQIIQLVNHIHMGLAQC